MATTQAVKTITAPANADLSASQFKLGVLNSTGKVAVNSVAGARADGVIANKPTAAGQAVELQVGGLVKVMAGGAITPGDEVMADGNGKVITATTTNEVFGIYKGSAASADGQIIQVLVDKYHKV